MRALALLFALASASSASSQRRLDVSPTDAYHSVRSAVAVARDGDTVVVHAGTYGEPTVDVAKRIVLLGVGAPILDGEGKRGLLSITADDVTVRGFVLRNVGTSFVEDRAAIRVSHARWCSIDAAQAGRCLTDDHAGKQASHAAATHFSWSTQLCNPCNPLCSSRSITHAVRRFRTLGQVNRRHSGHSRAAGDVCSFWRQNLHRCIGISPQVLSWGNGLP